MPQVFYILFGGVFTGVVCILLGRLFFRSLSLRLHRLEEEALGFVAGSAILSLLTFALCALHLARKGVFLALGGAIIAAAVWRGAHRSSPHRLPPLPTLWKWVFLVPFGLFLVLYLFNAMDPEFSADGTTYHLGIVAQYLRAHGFERITTNMYANLSQGVELLFLFAFAFGKHSAATMVHFWFLLALALGMLSYARRFGIPAAGVCGALFVFLSPLYGVDATSAYNDVAVAAIAFTLFYLLQIWDAEGKSQWFIALGLIGGFCYAAKYTAFVGVPYVVGFICWKNYRRRQPVVKPVLVISMVALVMMLPWMVKNWIWLDNPFSPFFNALFPNPYINIAFEKGYTYYMRHYEGLTSYWYIPFEVTMLGGKLCGFLGPVFLLAPLGVFALRWPAGRQLLLAGAVFGVTYFTNVGTRFLLPAAPFFALAMGMTLVSSKGMALPVVLLHVLLSWPSVAKRYCSDAAWRLETIPVKAALRIEPEEAYLKRKMPFYAVAQMLEQTVPPGAKVLCLTQAAEAYTSRDVLVVYESWENNTLGDILWTPLIPIYMPTWQLQFRFPQQSLRRVRVVQTATADPDQWSMAEMRVFHQKKELERLPEWRLRAKPNPWEVQLAFDNSPVTRWRSWQTIFPGMFVEVDFGRVRQVDSVLLECSHDQYKIKLKLEGQDETGAWKLLAAEPEEADVSPPMGLRRAAAQELKARGISYLLAYNVDHGADDYRIKSVNWGFKHVGATPIARLYQIW